MNRESQTAEQELREALEYYRANHERYTNLKQHNSKVGKIYQLLGFVLNLGRGFRRSRIADSRRLRDGNIRRNVPLSKDQTIKIAKTKLAKLDIPINKQTLIQKEKEYFIYKGEIKYRLYDQKIYGALAFILSKGASIKSSFENQVRKFPVSFKHMYNYMLKENINKLPYYLRIQANTYLDPASNAPETTYLVQPVQQNQNLRQLSDVSNISTNMSASESNMQYAQAMQYDQNLRERQRLQFNRQQDQQQQDQQQQGGSKKKRRSKSSYKHTHKSKNRNSNKR